MEKYELLKPLGEGSSGMVFEAKIKKNKEENKENVAIKCIFKLDGYDNKDLSEEVKNEINIMKLLENENKYSIKLLDYFEDSVAYYLVEELMPYNLYNYINEHELTSENIKKFIHQFCEAYSKLIEYDIEHNDISLRNILINDNFDIKLCDYNCSKINNFYEIHTKSLNKKINDFKIKYSINSNLNNNSNKNLNSVLDKYLYIDLNSDLNSDLIKFCEILKYILSKEYQNKNESKNFYYPKFENIYNLILDILDGKNKSWVNIFELENIEFPKKKIILPQPETKFQNIKLLENFILKTDKFECEILSCGKRRFWNSSKSQKFKK